MAKKKELKEPKEPVVVKLVLKPFVCTVCGITFLSDTPHTKCLKCRKES